MRTASELPNVHSSLEMRRANVDNWNVHADCEPTTPLLLTLLSGRPLLHTKQTTQILALGT